MQRKHPRLLLIFVPLVPLAGMMLSAGAASSSSPLPPIKRSVAVPANSPSFERDALPLVQKYCLTCHSGTAASGGIRLDRDKTSAEMLAHRDLWDQVARNVDNKHMPPDGSSSPTGEERSRIVNYVQSTLSKADCVLHDPGRVTVRRLNRVEYDNTIRDLTGLDLHVSDDFPSDNVGYGFDNIGDVLSLSPLQLEKYLAAAAKIAHAAIIAPEEAAQYRHFKQFAGYQLNGDGESHSPDARIFATNGTAGTTYNFPAPGRYRIGVVAWGDQAGPDPARMAVWSSGRRLAIVDVKAVASHPETYTVDTDVPAAGPGNISVSFLNDYYDATSTNPKLRGDRNLYVDSVTITPLTGSVAEIPQTEFERRYLTVRPTANSETAMATATRKDIANFAYRAYRRPLAPDEIDRLCRIAALVRARGGSWERSMQVAVEATLVSPNFLFRIERDLAPNDRTVQHPISDYALATRLSYFLWSSQPDDRLLTLAAQGKLHRPTVLLAETHRLLADPRAANALGDNFAAQWLTLRKLQNATPDQEKFPLWNDDLRSSMRSETLLYFQNIVRNDRSVLELLDSDYTYLNEPLAKLYGVPSVSGNDFRRVTLNGGQRGGVLTQASVLTVTSNPTRTSPVKRGKWVMENLLGVDIPAPPPGVPQLADDKHGVLVGTLRQRMERHRADPACASCHAQMDPIGFALENYDAIGKWRTLDDAKPIDASGNLPGGAPLHGPAELRAALKGKKPQFVHNLAVKMLTYALGRGIEGYDRCNVDLIAQQVAKKNYKFSALVDSIVTSDPFLNRRGDSPAGADARVASLK